MEDSTPRVTATRAGIAFIYASVFLDVLGFGIIIPALPAWSRPVLILSAIGLGLDYVIMALAPTLTWLFVGRVISGVTSASYAASFAYVADVTPPARRAGAYGSIGALWGIGFILGPAVGGLL